MLSPVSQRPELSDQDKKHGNNLKMFVFPPLCQHLWRCLHWVLYMVLYFGLLFDTIHKAICVLTLKVSELLISLKQAPLIFFACFLWNQWAEV